MSLHTLSVISEKLKKWIRRWKRAAGRRTEGGKIKWSGMRANIIEGMQTYIQSNVERENKRLVLVAWRGGEAIRQKG
jgi:hypothetical protein